MTLDERKTLTKVSTRKPLTNIPQNKSACLGTRKPGKRMQTPSCTNIEEKVVCIIGGESGALGFHQETTRSVLYKTLPYIL